MTKVIRLLPVMFLFAALLLASCGRSRLPEPGTSTAESPCPDDDAAAEVAAAKLYIEYNATDGDLGVHGAVDSDGWSVMCLYAPDGRLLLAVEPRGELGRLNLGGFFFESREPELDEFGFEELAAEFPEGEYTVKAVSTEGEVLGGAATFSHDVPAAPEITAPDLAGDEEGAAEAPVSPAGLVVRWGDVTETTAGEPLTITGYEVIITKVDYDDPHGFSQPVYDVHVPPSAKELSVPAEFLEPGTVYELEVLALEGSGNQTISVGFFMTG